MKRNTINRRRHGRFRVGAWSPLLLLALSLILAACSSPDALLPETAPQATTAVATPSGTDGLTNNADQAITTSTAALTTVESPSEPAQPTDTPTATPIEVPTLAATQVPAPPQPSPGETAIGSEILFLRRGALLAYAVDTGQERQIASDVREFAATPNGRTLALVRNSGRTADLWLVARDGSDLRQVTRNERAESNPSWAPDGLTLVYASSTAERQSPPDWPRWATWCGTSEVRLLDVTSGVETTLAPGCDPAFSPDGRRIAFATPPLNTDPAGGTPGVANTIRLVNRQGENGWDFAIATGQNDDSGLLVYAPAWSPDGLQLAYQRFKGYMALTDINFTEMGGSYEGKGKLLNVGFGWLLPPVFAPDGRNLAVMEHNYSDARGFSGYDIWGTNVLRPGEQGEVVLPDGTRTTYATRVDSLARTTGAAWSPDASALVVALPPGWFADASTQEPVFSSTDPGDLWRWVPDPPPTERLVQNVDFASPLAWLPPLPQVEVSSQGYRLVYPADWQLTSTEFEELHAVAPDGLRMIHAALLPAAPADLTTLGVADTFPNYVGSNPEESEPITWPDGSIYRGFTGSTPDGTPVAGAMRAVKGAGDTTIVMLYRTTPQLWPLERAQAQDLLAASGR